MATKFNATAKGNVSKLHQVFNTSVSYYGSKDKVQQAVEAIGEVGQEYAKKAAWAGYVAYRKYGTDAIAKDHYESAMAIVNMPGFNKNQPTANGRRTSVEEQWLGAARTEWKRILQKAGIKTTEKRGGSRKGTSNKTIGTGKAKGEKDAPKQDNVVQLIPAKQVTPKVTTEVDLAAWVKAEVTELRAFQKRNAKAPGMSKLATALAAAAKLLEEALNG